MLLILMYANEHTHTYIYIYYYMYIYIYIYEQNMFIIYNIYCKNIEGISWYIQTFNRVSPLVVSRLDVF